MVNTTFAVDWIKSKNYWKDFLIFCSTIPSVKSFKRKVYLYLVHKKFFGMKYVFCNRLMTMSTFSYIRDVGAWTR